MTLCTIKLTFLCQTPIWRSAPSNVRLSKKLSIILAHFKAISFIKQILFLGQTANFCLYHVIHILNAYGSVVNLGYLEPISVHPTRRQIFVNTLGLICKLDFAMCLIVLFFSFLYLIIYHKNKISIILKYALWEV